MFGSNSIQIHVTPIIRILFKEVRLQDLIIQKIMEHINNHWHLYINALSSPTVKSLYAYAVHVKLWLYDELKNLELHNKLISIITLFCSLNNFFCVYW